LALAQAVVLEAERVVQRLVAAVQMVVAQQEVVEVAARKVAHAVLAVMVVMGT